MANVTESRGASPAPSPKRSLGTLSALLAALSVAAALLCGHPALAAGYGVSAVIDSTNPTFSDFTAPALNLGGTIAFQGSLDAGGYGVFTATSGTLTPIAVSNQTFDKFTGVGISDAGNVAFEGLLTNGDTGFFLGNGGPLTTLALLSEPLYSFFYYPPVIDRSGKVVFTALLDGGGRVVDAIKDGVTTRIAESVSAYYQDISPTRPSINASGLVAYEATPSSPLARESIYTSSGIGAPTLVLAENGASGGFASFFYEVQINDSGKIAFRGVKGITSGIYTVANGVVTTITTFGSGQVGMSLNSSGTVAYLNVPASGGGGIFTGNGTTTTPVLGIGDPFEGSTVSTLSLDPRAFNDAGQIAFAYGLADGRKGIALATPVPEPSVGVFLTFGAAALITRRRR